MLVRDQQQQPKDAQQQIADGIPQLIAALWASMGPAVLGIGQPRERPPRAPQDVGAWADDMLRPGCPFDPEVEALITTDGHLFFTCIPSPRPLPPLSPALEWAVVRRSSELLIERDRDRRGSAVSARDVLQELLKKPILAHLNDLPNAEHSIDKLLWDLRGKLLPGTTHNGEERKQQLVGLGGPAGVLALGRAAPEQLRDLLGSVVAVRALLFSVRA